MRHRRRGRQLGRTSPHRKAMLRNMASSLFLTERSELANEIHGNTPRVRRRIVTTIQKAKEVRSIVEKCITLARKVQPCYEQAADLLPASLQGDGFDKSGDAYKTWRKSDQWQQWAEARAPIVNAQRKALQMLGNREAVDILFNDIAPALIEENPERVSGFTRILKIAKPRLGDNGTQAILEIVGESNNRDTSGSMAPQAPVVEDDDSQEDSSVVEVDESADAEAAQDDGEESAEDSSDDSAGTESSDEDSADQESTEEATEEEASDDEAADSDDAEQDSPEESEVAEASDDAEEAEAEAEATDDTEEEEAGEETE